MDVLFDYRPALRARTGVGEYVHELAAALARTYTAGEHLHLFSSSWKDRLEPGLERLPGARLHDHHVPVQVLNALWHRLRRPSVEWLTSTRYDVVHAAHPLLIPSRGAAGIVTVHDLDFLDHPERTSAEIRRDYPALVRSSAERADGILAVSEDTRRQVITRLGVAEDRVVVARAGLPRWVDGGRSAPRPVDGYILFLGTLEPRKNVEGLLNAYEALIARRKDIPRLRLAGRETAAARPWLDRIARPPLSGHVEYDGYVSDERRRALFEGASMLVLPSWHEGFGLPALEGMALGVPLVVSRRGALPEVAGDAALYIEPDEADSIAHAMERVLDDRDGTEARVAAGLARVAPWSWDRTAEEVRGLYRAALTRRMERDAHRG